MVAAFPGSPLVGTRGEPGNEAGCGGRAGNELFSFTADMTLVSFPDPPPKSGSGDETNMTPMG